MPSKFRDELGDKFIITKGLDNCLFAYPPQEWEAVVTKLRTLPLTDRDARAFVRFIAAGAMECEVDKQGRILIPSNLREYAALDKEILITGAITRIEMWNRENWMKHSSDYNESADKIAEKMALLGI